MATLFFLLTLANGSHCGIWLFDNVDYIDTFAAYPDVVSVDVFDSDAIDDRLLDVLFTRVYSIRINGVATTVQCQ